MGHEWLFVLSWYIGVQAVGLATLPLTTSLLSRLPDRGYAFARPFGILLTSYLLWLGGSFGMLANRQATFTVVVLAVAGVAWSRRDAVARIRALWLERRGLIVGVELLFAAAFLGLCVVRSYLPDIAATEKPMEFAFLNALLRGEHFPPTDPWLAGYSISYYYMGYLQAALLTMLADVPAAIGYNLMLATLFALTATGAFGIGYDLTSGLRERPANERGGSGAGPNGPLAVGFLTALFTLGLANWEGALELLHAHGIGSVAFWSSIGIAGLDHPYLSPTWNPTDSIDNWWWFRAARVIGTTSPDGRGLDYTINEFPAFSFILGDVHPHVLALPFVFLALALALNTIRSSAADSTGWPRVGGALPSRLTWTAASRATEFVARYLVLAPIRALREATWPVLGVGLIIGGLGFLNAWDLPTYLVVLALAFGLGRHIARPDAGAATRQETISFGWTALLMSLVMYLPFYVGLRSQTSGILPVAYRSQLAPFAVFWAPLLGVVAAFLLAELARWSGGPSRDEAGEAPRPDWTRYPELWPLVLGLATLLLALRLPPIAALVPFWLQAPALAIVIPLGAAAVVVLWRSLADSKGEQAPRAPRQSSAPEYLLVLALALTALLLIGGTELLFVKDLFNNRMNTVFKLYYQAWALLSVVAAYGLYHLYSLARAKVTPGLSRAGALIALVAAVVVVLPGLVYTPAALASRIGVSGGSHSLDGIAWLARSAPADAAAIDWLEANVSGNPVVVEASGGSYSQFARVSSSTGLPTILGWEFHEVQWRGTADPQRQRQVDLATIYGSNDPNAVLAALASYDAQYVYVGALEREKYGAGSALTDFSRFMATVYNQNGVSIYRVR